MLYLYGKFGARGVAGAHSRRIAIPRRLVHEVFADRRIVRMLRILTHCE